MNIFAVIDKQENISFSSGALYSLVAIIMVFVILLIIIGITTLIFKINGLFDMKKELDTKLKEKHNQTEPVLDSNSLTNSVDIKDDDMMAAVLVATIDYQEEIKKDVRVLYVKEL